MGISACAINHGPMRAHLLGLTAVLFACGGPTGPLDSGTRMDSGIEGQRDGGSDASVSGCGDGVIDEGEACDGTATACSELGASWTGGQAACRADCSGWDVGACMRPSAPRWEAVKPAERDAARFGGALCNDGTPFTFVVRLAPEPSSEWVIHLQGGVFCDDAAISCADRLRDDPELTTTSPFADRSTGPLTMGGIFSGDPTINPDFSAVNEVLAFYCSSDFWTGTDPNRRPTIADPEGWYFAGRANVSAMLDVLTERYGLSDGDATTRVLWGGSSAGAFGAQFNLPRVREELPGAFADERVLYFGDAPWMLDWDDPTHRITTTTIPDRDVWRGALAFWGGRLNSDCEATVTDPIDCWFGAAWYPIVRAMVPVLVQQSTIDGSFGYFLHGFTTCSEAGVCTDPGDQSSLDTWSDDVASELASVDRLFSGHQRYHTLAASDAGLGVGPAGSTLRDVLHRYWTGGPPERVTFSAP